jgi:hypothetical protein
MAGDDFAPARLAQTRVDAAAGPRETRPVDCDGIEGRPGQIAFDPRMAPIFRDPDTSRRSLCAGTEEGRISRRTETGDGIDG